MRFRRPARGATRTAPRLMLVPLIDVVLFLLLYFMVTTTFVGPESQLSTGLRTDEAPSGRALDLPPLILDVEPDAAGEGARFRMGERITGDRDALTALLRELPKEGGVVVRVSDSVAVAAAAAAVQACKDAGFGRVSYVPAGRRDD